MINLEFNLNVELNDLKIKINKLKMFKLSDKWKKLDTHEACLLDVQERIMEAYAEILTDRICLLRQRKSEDTMKSIKITIEGNED